MSPLFALSIALCAFIGFLVVSMASLHLIPWILALIAIAASLAVLFTPPYE